MRPNDFRLLVIRVRYSSILDLTCSGQPCVHKSSATKLDIALVGPLSFRLLHQLATVAFLSEVSTELFFGWLIGHMIPEYL